MGSLDVTITINIKVRPAGVQIGNGEQPRRGRPSRSVETVELVRRLAASRGSRMTPEDARMSHDVLYDWAARQPEFSGALKGGAR